MQTLRFEGKHNYFKELVNRTKNRVNICKSLAERQLYYQCIYNTCTNFFDSGQFESSDGQTLPVCLLQYEFQEKLADPDILKGGVPTIKIREKVTNYLTNGGRGFIPKSQPCLGSATDNVLLNKQFKGKLTNPRFST